MTRLARLWAALRPDHRCRNVCGRDAGPDHLLCGACRLAESARAGLHPTTAQGGQPQ